MEDVEDENGRRRANRDKANVLYEHWVSTLDAIAFSLTGTTVLSSKTERIRESKSAPGDLYRPTMSPSLGFCR